MKLSRSEINHMANKFVISLEDKQKQEIVDQLGIHPVNHAEFIDELNVLTGGHGNIGHNYAYASYLHCVKWINEKYVVVEDSV